MSLLDLSSLQIRNIVFFTAGNDFCFICIVSFFVAGVKYPALVELRGSAPKCPLKPRVAPGWRQFYQQVGQLFLPNVWGGRQWASVRKIHYAVFEIQIKIQNWASMLLQRNEDVVNLHKVEYFPPMSVKCKTPKEKFPPEAGNKRWDKLTCNGCRDIGHNSDNHQWSSSLSSIWPMWEDTNGDSN